MANDKNATAPVTDGAAAAPTRKRAAFTRTEKPVFLIIKYTDPATGQPVKLDRDKLEIVAEKDASKIVTLVTGEGMGDATVVTLQLPKAEAKPAAEAAPAA